jgi:predicted esterase
VTHAASLARTDVVLCHGRFDPVVPCTHSTGLFRDVTQAAPEARIFLEIFDGGHEMPLARLETLLRERLQQGRDAETATG